MSSINQILNSALMETVETENLEEGYVNNKYISRKLSQPRYSEAAAADNKLHGTLSNPVKAIVAGTALTGVSGAIANETEGGPGSVKSQIPPTTPATPTESPAASKVTSWADKIMTGAKDVYAAHPDKVKYAGAGAVALGAGLGAMALARKLRNKKKAVKKA